MITRRSLSMAGGMALLASFSARAQPKDKVWRVGFIGVSKLGTSPLAEQAWGIFVQALRERGFVEGKNVVFERRATEGRVEQASTLAAELVSLGVDVILASPDTSAMAAQAATPSIPIVMVGVVNPVGSGLAASLARPGGNVTGVGGFGSELITKRLELLKAAVPTLARVALVEDEIFLSLPSERSLHRREDAAAGTLDVSLVRVALKGPQDFQKATSDILRESVDGIETFALAAFSLRKEFAGFAIQHRLPLAANSRAELLDGALMFYGPDFLDMFSKAASYVAKILYGARPADLPIEQPTKFQLLINLKTARAIGVTIPRSLLLQAEQVIQ